MNGKSFNLNRYNESKKKIFNQPCSINRFHHTLRIQLFKLQWSLGE